MLGRHDRAVLQFSGGADSTALLYLARPYLDHITVLFTDTGATFPHVAEHVHRTCDALGARLQVIRPPMPVRDWHTARGLPSDIAPEWATADMAWTQKDPPATLLQPTMACCAAMLWQPTMAAVTASGATLVLRGSKAADERVGARPGFLLDGIEYASPLWDWTDADVLAYLRAEGVTLPKHYEHVKDSLDCTLCTGHTGAHYAKARTAYIRDHHPEVWAELAPRMRAVSAVLKAEQARHMAVLEMGDTE
ncbi:phosphoadenosine phosphosulfate reductase domain-containing protein [Azospirillum sp. sgz302134]